MLRNYNIQNRLFITIMSLILLTVLVMGGIPYIISRDTVLDEVKYSNEKYVVSLANGADQNINQIEELLSQIQYSQDITSLATDQSLTNQEIVSLRKSISNQIKTLLTGKEHIAGLNVYLKNGIVFSFGHSKVGAQENYEESSWYKAAQTGNGRARYISPGMDEDSKKVTQNCIVTALIISRNFSTPIGAVYASVDPSYFGDAFVNNRNSQIFIMDKTSALVYSNIKGQKASKETYINDIIKDLNAYYELLPQERKEKIATKTYKAGRDVIVTEEMQKYLGYKVKGNMMVSYSPLKGGCDWVVVSLTPEQSFIKPLGKIYWSVLTVSAVMIIVCLIISRILTSSISEPVQKLSQFFKKLSEGDLTQNLIDSSKDEIGQLTREASNMKENVVRLLKEVHDASVLINKTSETIEASIDFNIEISRQLSTTLQSLAAGVSQTSGNTEDAVGAMTKLADSINKVDEVTEKVNKMTFASQNLSAAGTETASRLTNSSYEMQLVNERINTEVDELTKTAKDIHLIVGSIENIAEQTNLLALNAAIESARVGEAGRGFAVVSKEISNLAAGAKQAAGSIRLLLGKIDDKVNTTTQTSQNAKEIVEKEVDAVRQTTDTLNDITQTMSDMSNRIREVKDSVSIIMNQKNQALTALESTASVVQETSVALQQISASSEEQTAVISKLGSTLQELNQTMNIMNNSMKQFKFEN